MQTPSTPIFPIVEEIWHYIAPNRTPDYVAQIFATGLFPGRTVCNFQGGWDTDYNGGKWTFQLIDGLRTYTMTCSKYGLYQVYTD